MLDDDHEPISLEQMRQRIRYRRGRRSLLKYLQAIELTKRVVFVRREPGPKRTRYLVTKAAIREHAPELIRDETPRAPRPDLSAAREFIQELDDKMADAAVEMIERRVSPRLERVERRVSKLEQSQLGLF